VAFLHHRQISSTAQKQKRNIRQSRSTLGHRISRRFRLSAKFGVPFALLLLFGSGQVSVIFKW